MSAPRSSRPSRPTATWWRRRCEAVRRRATSCRPTRSRTKCRFRRTPVLEALKRLEAGSLVEIIRRSDAGSCDYRCRRVAVVSAAGVRTLAADEIQSSAGAAIGSRVAAPSGNAGAMPSLPPCRKGQRRRRPPSTPRRPRPTGAREPRETTLRARLDTPPAAARVVADPLHTPLKARPASRRCRAGCEGSQARTAWRSGQALQLASGEGRGYAESLPLAGARSCTRRVTLPPGRKTMFRPR